MYVASLLEENNLSQKPNLHVTLFRKAIIYNDFETLQHLMNEQIHGDVLLAMINEHFDFQNNIVETIWNFVNSSIQVNDIHTFDINPDIKYTCCPLSYAVQNELEHVIKILLQVKEINVNRKELHFPNTSLIVATFNGLLSIVKILLSHAKINVNIQGICNYTALIYAVEQEYLEITQCLLNHEEIDINLRNCSGQSALIIACRNNSVDMVQAILDSKKVIKLNFRDIFGKTAMDYAKGQDFQDIFIVLQSYQIQFGSNEYEYIL